MSNTDFCKAKLKEAFPGVRGEVLESIAEQMEYFKKKSKSKSEMQKMAKEFYKEYTQRAEKTVANAIEDALKIDQEVNFISSNFKDNPLEGLQSLIHDVASDRAGTSIESYAHTVSQEAFSLLNVGLTRSGLLKVAKSGDLDRDIFKIAYARKNKFAKPTDVDPRAFELADIYAKVTNYLQDTLEASGSMRGRREGYLGRRTYDAVKLKDMGFESFHAYMTDPTEGRLDLESTYGYQFDDPVYIREHLQDMYNSLITEQIEPTSIRAVDSDSIAAFMGMSKDQKRSTSRSLIYKSADAEYDLHHTLGKGLIMQDIVSAIGRDARHAGAMTKLGPNYNQNWAAIKSLISQNSDTKQALKIRDSSKHLDGVFNVTVNGFNVGTSPTAKLAVAAKAVNRTAVLGGVVSVSSWTDFFTHALNVRSLTGKNIFQTTFDSLDAYIRNVNFSKADRLEYYEISGSYINNGLGEHHSRFSPDEIVMGATSRMQDLFFRFSGQTYQSGHWQFSNEMHLGDIVYRHIKDGLKNKNFMATMDRFGISKHELELLSRASYKVNGRDVITTTSVDSLNLSPKHKNELKMKLGSFLKYNAQFISHPAPGVKTRFLLNMGLDQNSPMGIATNLATDLMSFPVSMLHVASNHIRSGGEGKSFSEAMTTTKGIKNAAVMFVGLMTAGAISQISRDASKNKKSQLDSVDFWMRSATLGGAMGLYGDFLFADHSKGFISPAGQLAGPVIGGPVTDLLDSTSSAMRGDWQLNPREVKKMWDRVPGNNLFYLKAMLDYYILEEMQEAVQPGYRQRKTRNARRRGEEPLFGR